MATPVSRDDLYETLFPQALKSPRASHRLMSGDATQYKRAPLLE